MFVSSYFVCECVCCVQDVTLPGTQTVKLQVWDTAGNPRYRAISQSYARGTIILIVLDLSAPASWTDTLASARIISNNVSPTQYVAVVCSKADARADTDEGTKMALQNAIGEISKLLCRDAMPVYECSATDVASVQHVFLS